VTTVLGKHLRRWPARLAVAVLITTVLVLGGCSARLPSGHQANKPEQPLSDGQSVAQVVAAAKQIAKVSRLQDVSGSYRWESCNDRGEKPYRGRLDMTFVVPQGSDHSAYFQRIANTMESNGWSAGPPHGQHASGTVIHQDDVMASIGISPYPDADGSVKLLGQCRNMNDHRRDSGFSVTDQLVGG
jgi:hypothetical protein